MVVATHSMDVLRVCAVMGCSTFLQTLGMVLQKRAHLQQRATTLLERQEKIATQLDHQDEQQQQQQQQQQHRETTNQQSPMSRHNTILDEKAEDIRSGGNEHANSYSGGDCRCSEDLSNKSTDGGSRSTSGPDLCHTAMVSATADLRRPLLDDSEHEAAGPGFGSAAPGAIATNKGNRPVLMASKARTLGFCICAPTWLIGLGLQQGLPVLALYYCYQYAPMSMVTPMVSLWLVWNMLISRQLLPFGEEPPLCVAEVMAAALLVTGCAGATAYSGKGDWKSFDVCAFSERLEDDTGLHMYVFSVLLLLCAASAVIIWDRRIQRDGLNLPMESKIGLGTPRQIAQEKIAEARDNSPSLLSTSIIQARINRAEEPIKEDASAANKRKSVVFVVSVTLFGGLCGSTANALSNMSWALFSHYYISKSLGGEGAHHFHREDGMLARNEHVCVGFAGSKDDVDSAILGLVLCGLTFGFSHVQLVNYGLSILPQTLVAPLDQAFWTISSVMYGSVIFAEYPTDLPRFGFSILLVVMGVCCFSAR